MSRSLFQRVRGRLVSTTEKYRQDCNFSKKYAALRVKAELGGRLHFKKYAAKAAEQRDRWIMQYLESALSDTWNKYQGLDDAGLFCSGAPIWICWWTGEETAPTLVKHCIQSIRENAGKHPVILIDQNNYNQYLEIPTYILEKASRKSMCIANLSDYIRFSLLAKYGGLWLDATIYCAEPLDESLFEVPLFTCKGRTGDGHYISDYRWTSFCFGGYQGNMLFRFIQACFEDYWKKHDTIIDYLMIDYLLNLAYTHIPAIQKMLDAIPDNNLHRDDLQSAMNAALPASAFDQVIQEDTTLYKLSWRETYSLTTSDGSNSIYEYFISKNR